nr:unnamed protein product [Digitaria exilis]
MRRAPLVKSRPATSPRHRPSQSPHPASPGSDPRDVAAPQDRHVCPQGPRLLTSRTFLLLPGHECPSRSSGPGRATCRGPGHVGVRCGALAPEETDTAQTSRLSASRLEKQVAAAYHSAATNTTTNALLARSLASLPSAARPASQPSKIAEKSAADSDRQGFLEEMNGRGNGGGGGGEEEMEEDGGGAGCAQGAGPGPGNKERVVLMWGYLPGVSPQRSPLLGPVPVRLPAAAAAAGGDGWRDVCGGGCGFAMAISGDLKG